MPETFAILIDVDTALDGTENPYYSAFINKNITELSTLSETIVFFLLKNRDFLVLHYTPHEAKELGYFEREDCLIFPAW